MTMLLTVNGYDVTPKVPFDSYQIQDSLQARGDTLSFRIPLGVGELHLRPQSGQPVVLDIDGARIFAGDVSTITETRPINADYFDYEVTCQDHTRRLDRVLVVLQEIGPDLAGNIIRRILIEFAPEFAGDLSGIEDGLTVGKQTFDYVPVTSILDQLAQESLMLWFVEPSKRIVFASNVEYPAPLDLYDVDTELRLGDFTWEESVDQVKNRIYLKDAAVKDSDTRSDVWLADGQTSFFKAYNEPYDENVTVTGTGSSGPKQYQTFLESGDNDDGTLIGEAGTVAICVLNWGIRFPLDGLPEANEVVEMIYNPTRSDLVYMVEDPDSQHMIAAREGYGNGVYEHMVSLPDVRVDSDEPIEAYGRILLDRIAWPEIRGGFASLELTDWKAGQTFYITSAKRELFDPKVYWKSGQSDQSPIQVWVQSVSKTIKGRKDDGGTWVEVRIEYANTPLSKV